MYMYYHVICILILYIRENNELTPPPPHSHSHLHTVHTYKIMIIMWILGIYLQSIYNVTHTPFTKASPNYPHLELWALIIQ